MKVASVTVMAMIQGFTADRSAAARGKGMEAVIELISEPTPPSMQQETGRSHLNAWYDAASDHSVAEHLLVGVEKWGKGNKRLRKSPSEGKGAASCSLLA